MSKIPYQGKVESSSYRDLRYFSTLRLKTSFLRMHLSQTCLKINECRNLILLVLLKSRSKILQVFFVTWLRNLAPHSTSVKSRSTSSASRSPSTSATSSCVTYQIRKFSIQSRFTFSSIFFPTLSRRHRSTARRRRRRRTTIFATT